MSVLLRCPASVPSLFCAAEPDPAPPRRAMSASLPLGAASTWAAVVLIEVPLVKAAAALVGLALPH